MNRQARFDLRSARTAVLTLFIAIAAALASVSVASGAYCTNCVLQFPTTAALLTAYPSGVTPPANTQFCTSAYSSSDPASAGGACFIYDSTIPAPATVTASASFNPFAPLTTLTVTAVASGTIHANEYVSASGCEPYLNIIEAFGTKSTTGTGGTGTYALAYPWNCSGQTMTVTPDDGGEVRLDGANHGFRTPWREQIFAGMFGAVTSNNATNAIALQNALAELLNRTCLGQSAAYLYRADTTLFFSGNQYRYSSPLYAGTDGYTVCQGETLQGVGNAQTQLLGLSFSSPAPALDASGQTNFTLINIRINPATSVSVPLFIGAIPETGSSSGNQINLILKSSALDAAGQGCTTCVAGAMVEGADLSNSDRNSSVTGYTSGSGEVDSLVTGYFLPYANITGSFGIAQGGSSNSLQLASGASATDNIFNGLPFIVCQSNSSGICSGTKEFNTVCGYVGSTTTVTPCYAWSSFTPTSSSTYVIFGAGSAFQPFAGLGSGGGCTYQSWGGYFAGSVRITGCQTENFADSTFFASAGNPAATFILDQAGNLGNDSGGLQLNAPFINRECDAGTNNILVWNREDPGDSVNVGGRIQLCSGGSPAFFRMTAADFAASPIAHGDLYSYPFGSITINTNGLVGGPLFNLAPQASANQTTVVALLNLTDPDTGSPTFGSINSGTITNCQWFYTPFTAAAFQANCLAGNYNGSKIAAGPTPALTGTCSTSSQTGGTTAGTFEATCSSQTVIIALPTAPNGWNCIAQDLTTPADTLKQIATATTSCTLTGTTASADVVSYAATAY